MKPKINDAKLFEFMDGISIAIYNIVVRVKSPNWNRNYSCYNLKVLIAELSPFTTDDNMEDILEHIYDECEFIEPGEWKICDCWIENIFCYCKPKEEPTIEVKLDKEDFKTGQTKLF